MGLPPGTIQEQGIKLKEINFKNKLFELVKQKFTGYLALTIDGFDGLEEGIVIFKDGALEGSTYEYLKYGITVLGDYAFPQVCNATASDYGIIDIIKLNSRQVELIVSLNTKIQIRKQIKGKDLDKLIPKKFDSGYAEKVLKSVLEKTETSNAGKEDLFKRLGISDIQR